MARFHQERDPVQWSRYCDSAAAANMGGVGEIIIVCLARREVDGDALSALCDDWFRKEACGAKVELVFQCKRGFVTGVCVKVWLEYGNTGDGGGVEGCIPSWEQLVTETKRLCYNRRIGLASEIWFTTTSVDVGVPTEERIKGASLVPAGEKLFARVAEEAANICPSKWEAGNVVRQEHRD